MNNDLPPPPCGLNARWLHYFFTALSAGSIRGASDRLDVEPSVISRQIRQLEQQLEMPLLERHGRGVRATEAGEILFDYYREREVAEQTLLGRLAELDGLQRGQISLSVSEGYSDTLMTSVINRFCARHPRLQLHLSIVSVNEVVRQVFEGQAHIGVAYSPRLVAGVRSAAAACQPVCAIVNPDHPLNASPLPLSLDALTAWPLGLVDQGFGLRQLIDTVEFIEKRSFNPTLTSNSLATLKQFVSTGLGVTFMTEVALHHEIQRGQLRALPIDHPVFAGAESHVLVRERRPLSAAARQLLGEIVAMAPFCAARVSS